MIGPIVFRLEGIDAPEAGQSCVEQGGGTWSCGSDATNRLADLINGKETTCLASDRDRYGRIIARCSADGVDLSTEMIEGGLAWALREYTATKIANEDCARAAAVGIWSAPNQTP